MCDPSKDTVPILTMLSQGRVPVYQKYRTIECTTFDDNEIFITPVTEDVIYDYTTPVYLVNKFTGTRDPLPLDVQFKEFRGELAPPSKRTSMRIKYIIRRNWKKNLLNYYMIPSFKVVENF